MDYYDDEDGLRGWDLSEWRKQKEKNVTITPLEGTMNKLRAYKDCANRLQEEAKHTWVAFLNMNEFLVMKKHDHVVDVFESYCGEGALAIHSYIFFPSPHVTYLPMPVTQRFLRRQELVSSQVKSVAVIADVDHTSGRIDPQNISLVRGNTHDTEGKPPSYDDPPHDVIVLHYYTRSQKEFCVGRKNKGNITNCRVLPKHQAVIHDVFDDSAWLQLKKFVPKYHLYDIFLQKQ